MVEPLRLRETLGLRENQDLNEKLRRHAASQKRDRGRRHGSVPREKPAHHGALLRGIPELSRAPQTIWFRPAAQ
jgi:hypothetical protein